MVYDLREETYVERGSSIPDYKTFAIFDEARSRGADLTLDS